MGELIIQRVHLLNALYGVVVGLVIQVQSVGLDVSTQELEAVLVGLVVEFLLVQAHTFCRQSLAEFWEQRQGVGMVLFAHYLYPVVHEKGCTNATLIIQPAHLVVQVQAHADLRRKTAYWCAYARRFAKQRFLGLDMFSPEVLWCAQLTMIGGIAVYANHCQPL